MTKTPAMPPLWPQIEACYPRLWRVVCGYELQPAAREDLMQEVLMALWESLPRLQDQDKLLPFALRVAHNIAASHVRQAVARPRSHSLDEPGLELVAEAPDPRSEYLFSALRQLPLNQRQPLMLQLEGFDYSEIAVILGISAENVGVRVHRARARLKQLMKEGEGA